METFAKVANVTPRPWVTGFVFDENAGAVFATLGNINIFYLNPLRGHAERFTPLDPAAVQLLVSEAIHEVCHTYELDHNSTFARVITEAMGLFPWSSLPGIRKAEGMAAIMKEGDA